MEKLKNFLSKNISWVIIGVLLFILIYTMCSANMYAQDEYNYSNISWTPQRLSSLSDIVHSVKKIYLNWSGRIIALGLSQLFLFLGSQYYDILNSIVFVFFIFMTGYVMGKKNTTLGIVSSVALVSIFVCVFWQEFIWLTGSFNYLWTVAFMLATMYYFYNVIINDKKLSIPHTCIFYFISFCTGLSHENTAFVTGMFIIILCLANVKKIWKWSVKDKIKIIVPIILFGIGSMILIFSPGNFGRLGDSDTSIYYDLILDNFYQIKEMIAIFIISTIAVCIFSKNFKTLLKENLLYFILPMAIAVLPMLIIHDFPQRAMLAYETCIIICIVNNINELGEILANAASSDKRKKIKNVLIAIVGIVGFIPLAYKAWFAVKYIEPYKEKVLVQLEYCRLMGMEDAVIEGFDMIEEAEDLDIYMDMFPKATDISIINAYMATYYDFNTISAIPKGCVFIEIDITGETDEDIPIYNLVKRDTGEFYSARITMPELQLPKDTYKNRICFLIPIVEYDNLKLELPEEIIEKITSIQFKTAGNIEEIEIEDFDLLYD